MIKKPKPIFDLNERNQYFFDQLCDHIDKLEAIDGIMLSVMAVNMGILSITLKQMSDSGAVDLAQDGSMNFTVYYSTIKDLYASLIDYADGYYMSIEDVDQLLKDCDIIFPPALKRLLYENT